VSDFHQSKAGCLAQRLALPKKPEDFFDAMDLSGHTTFASTEGQFHAAVERKRKTKKCKFAKSIFKLTEISSMLSQAKLC
jgi:hypothetical protein